MTPEALFSFHGLVLYASRDVIRVRRTATVQAKAVEKITFADLSYELIVSVICRLMP